MVYAISLRLSGHGLNCCPGISDINAHAKNTEIIIKLNMKLYAPFLLVQNIAVTHKSAPKKHFLFPETATTHSENRHM